MVSKPHLTQVFITKAKTASMNMKNDFDSN